MQLDKENIKKIVGIVSFAILLNWGLKNTDFLGRLLGLLVGLILPFLIGGALAFIINVPMRFLERTLFEKPYARRQKQAQKGKGKQSTLQAAKKENPPFWYRAKRPLSLVLSLVLVIGVMFIGMFLIVPEIANSVVTIANSLRSFPEQLHSWSQKLMEWTPQIALWLEQLDLNLDSINWQQVLTEVASFLQNGAGNVLSTTVNVAASIFNGVVTAFLAIVFSFYLLTNKEKLGSQIKQLLYAVLKEEHADYIIRVGRMANKTFANFLSGQCVEAVILGSLFFVSMSILQFPYALMISVLIGFTALIPVFGAFIGCAVGAFLILLVSPIRAFWFIVLFLCLQQFEGNVIYPKVVGTSIGLPGIWVLAAVTIGGGVGGLVGVLLSVPVASVLYALLRRDVHKRLACKE